MKQTVTILTALTLVVLLATGLIVMDSIDLNQRIVQLENELLEAHSRLEETQKRMKKQTEDLQASANVIQQSRKECDALARQLSEAARDSRAAYASAEEQGLLNEKARFELEELKTEYLDLSKACASLEAQISLLNAEAVESAAAYQQQSLADAKRIAALEQQLSAPPAPTPAPAVRRQQLFPY